MEVSPMPTVPQPPAPENVTALDLAALAHSLRMDMGQLGLRVDDVLVAQRAALADLWEKLRQLEARLDAR
jgi:hypothetical protein